MTAPALLSGLSAVASDYDAILCDVWGVIHDGKRAFAGAVDALKRFRMSRGPVVLITNAPVPKERVTPMLQRRLVTGERMMLAHVYLDKGCIVPKHAHENEQLTYILEGALRFWIGEAQDQVLDVRAGEVLHIPSNVPHKAEALEDTLDVDVFSPPRADWLAKTDDYLRR